jgi:Holliday junction resolvase RusA-like endonuclease
MALDVLTALGYWRDDAQIADLHLCKRWAEIEGLAVTVEKCDQ